MCINNIKKKDRIRELIQKNKSFFKCPVCSGIMSINTFGNLTCSFKHNFDLSKKGYLNLLTSNNAPVYSKELFEARHKVCEAGFYGPLIDELSKIINEYKKSMSHKKINVLDAGCGEFDRILNDKGFVIKVVPGSNYLKELREIIYIDKNVSDYSNNKVINYFKQKLDVEDIQNINYKFDISKDFLPYFIKMTPLTWGKSTERLSYIYEKNISSITVDLTLIIGTKKK